MIRRVFAQGCGTTPSAMCFWATAFLLLYGAGLGIGSLRPDLRQYTDTYLLAALGLACFANFGRNRTLHCGLTGPIFLFGAIAMALIDAQLWNVDAAALWGIVLIGVGISLVIEWRRVGTRSC
jgi:hypothetical protein